MLREDPLDPYIQTQCSYHLEKGFFWACLKHLSSWVPHWALSLENNGHTTSKGDMFCIATALQDAKKYPEDDKKQSPQLTIFQLLIRKCKK